MLVGSVALTVADLLGLDDLRRIGLEGIEGNHESLARLVCPPSHLQFKQLFELVNVGPLLHGQLHKLHRRYHGNRAALLDNGKLLLRVRHASSFGLVSAIFRYLARYSGHAASILAEFSSSAHCHASAKRLTKLPPNSFIVAIVLTRSFHSIFRLPPFAVLGAAAHLKLEWKNGGRRKM